VEEDEWKNTTNGEKERKYWKKLIVEKSSQNTFHVFQENSLQNTYHLVVDKDICN